MPLIRLATRPTVRPHGLTARAGLVLLVALAGLLMAGRLQAPPAVRTIAVGRVPLAVAVDARTRRVFVANYGAASVSMLDAASGAVLATVAVAPHPSMLAVAAAAGRVFVVSDNLITLAGTGPGLVGTGHVSVLDATNGHLLRTVVVGQGTHTLAVHERAGRVFVTDWGDDSVSLLDAHSGRVLRTTALGLTPGAIAADERTDRVLVPGAPLGHPYPLAVSLLAARSGTVLRTVRVGTSAAALTVDARTGQAFVSNSRDRTVLVLDGRDASVVHVVHTVAVRWAPGALAMDTRTGTIVVTHPDDASVSLVEAASGRVLRTVPVGPPPLALAVDQRRGRIIVLPTASLSPSGRVDQVQVLDGRTGRLLRTVAVGADASALALPAPGRPRRERGLGASVMGSCISPACPDHGHPALRPFMGPWLLASTCERRSRWWVR